MIIGVGTDIIEISRIEMAVKKESFLKRYFTVSEIARYQTKKHCISSIAADFAAKEAVAKAIGTGFRGFTPQDIALGRSQEGKPYVEVSGQCAVICQNRGIAAFHISLSHSNAFATAYVIAEGK